MGNKGYSIYKVCLTNEIISYIKKELTVKPFTQNSIAETIPFPVYQESDKKIYVPRFWGLKIFGQPSQVKITQGKSINIEFKGQLRKEPVNQEEIVDAYLLFKNNKITKATNEPYINMLLTYGVKLYGTLTPLTKYKTNNTINSISIVFILLIFLIWFIDLFNTFIII